MCDCTCARASAYQSVSLCLSAPCSLPMSICGAAIYRSWLSRSFRLIHLIPFHTLLSHESNSFIHIRYILLPSRVSLFSSIVVFSDSRFMVLSINSQIQHCLPLKGAKLMRQVRECLPPGHMEGTVLVNESQEEI